MRLSLFVFALALSFIVRASDKEFRVEDIRVEGLQRVSAGSVFSAFPVNVGDEVDGDRLAEAIRNLFAAGLFTDIQVGREGNTLVITVVERPSISEIEVEGNKNLPTEELLKGLKTAGLAEGEVFQRSTLERVELEILRSYVAQGRYNASVDAQVEEQPRNRVKLKIDIKEGPVSAIHHINIVGNSAFNDEELRDLIELKLTGFWSSIFSNDQYSKEKLNGDLERIRSHYLDNGYIKFSIESTQVSVSPDKEQVFITINVQEGPQFTIRDLHLKGDLKVDEEELRKLIIAEPGDVFSRQKLTFISDAISKRLGNEGYTFASVNAVPEPHEDNTATVTFYVEPGNRTYVRRVNFRGNVSTSDEVLRQEMVQMEAAAASTDLIELSKSKLERLGFFKTVTVETPLVPGTDDQIDVNYTVEEQPTGSLSASLGFSQGSGVIVGASISEKNFWGTGRRVSFGVNKSASVQSANFSYTNPYYTIDGVSRGFSLFYKETDYDEEDVTSYVSDSLGGSVNFGYPIDQYTRLNFGVGVTHTRIKTTDFPALEIVDFLEENGQSYTFYETSASWSRSTLNRGLYPTKGMSQSLTAKVALPEVSDYTYYKVSYNNDQYYPISKDHDWAVHLRGEVAYGDGYGDQDQLPFFEHYLAGGFGSVRGYESNSLGPKSTPDPDESNPEADPFGGNFKVESSLELIFPFAIMKDHSQIRSVLFLDGGNVFDASRGYDPAVDELRFSAGVALTWITPIGPLSFSLGKALNAKDEDETQFFQFRLGQTL
ncbi:outer membrane protein assembly factor BamA [Hahella ganghwensis]|uniref:outer membrane protein assembly factor BamA n=1 Tax=Hahella ganghwensis TaxID=286420 RepID=UPI00038031D2|nr:outer membrane protein assembly factor BamA [Hahella ganghwensis]